MQLRVGASIPLLTHQMLDVPVIQRPPAIVQLRREWALGIEAVADGTRNCAALGHAASFQAQPQVQFLPQRLCRASSTVMRSSLASLNLMARLRTAICRLCRPMC